MEGLPPAPAGTRLRILATTDLGATFVPVPTSYGDGGTRAGVGELLERERRRQPTVWLDAGDVAVGLWWNWCRMPAGISTGTTSPRTVAMLPHIVPRLGELLGRPLSAEPGAGGARAGLIRLVRRSPASRSRQPG
jgi:hypothetical protein